MNQPTDIRRELDELYDRINTITERMIEMRADYYDSIGELVDDLTPARGIERPTIPMGEKALRMAATSAVFAALFKLADHFDDVDEYHSVTHELCRDAWGSRPMKVRRSEPSPHAPGFDLRGDRS